MVKYYELTINTKEVDSILEKVVAHLPGSPVKQQKSSFFFTLEFYAEPEKIQELETKLKADSLRYMILAKKPQREVKPRRRPAIENHSFAESRRSQESKEKKVDLNAIDKKLKEILGE